MLDPSLSHSRHCQPSHRSLARGAPTRRLLAQPPSYVGHPRRPDNLSSPSLTLSRVSHQAPPPALGTPDLAYRAPDSVSPAVAVTSTMDPWSRGKGGCRGKRRSPLPPPGAYTGTGRRCRSCSRWPRRPAAAHAATTSEHAGKKKRVVPGAPNRHSHHIARPPAPSRAVAVAAAVQPRQIWMSRRGGSQSPPPLPNTRLDVDRTFACRIRT